MKTKSKTFLSVSSVIIITIIFHYIGWLRPIENFLRTTIQPGSQALYSLSIKIGDNEENFSNIDELKEAYSNLQTKILEYQSTIVGKEILKLENEELREQLNFKTKNNYTTIGAQVIGKNIDPLGNTIILDRGQNDGIQEDCPVITGEGIFIGKVIRVEAYASVVRLINDNQSKIAATIMNRDKSIGIVEGGYGISVRMNYIPQNEDINVGEIVITSGLEDLTPKGLLIGTIEAIEKEAYQPFQRTILKPLANLEKISLVSIIKVEE
jgi:rod shape-determining protein MreC